MKKAVSLLAVSIVLTATHLFADEHDPLASVRFLIGEWRAVGEGQPGEATGVATFAPALQGKVIMRTSYAEYPATDKRPASRHDDLMVIYPSGGALRADYYDSEGHAIRYAVRAEMPNRVTFTSDPVEGQPRYRLAYALTDGRLDGTFEIASPKTPTVFTTYLTWTSRQSADKR